MASPIERLPADLRLLLLEHVAGLHGPARSGVPLPIINLRSLSALLRSSRHMLTVGDQAYDLYCRLYAAAVPAIMRPMAELVTGGLAKAAEAAPRGDVFVVLKAKGINPRV